jgi:hypothetical protein
MRNTCKSLEGKSEEKRSLGRFRRVDNIKMDLKQGGRMVDSTASG